MNIHEFKKALSNSCEVLKENVDYLYQLDSATGDGDYGVTIGKIVKAIEETSKEDIKYYSDLFEQIGWNIMGVRSGSAGPLWASLFLGFSKGAGKKEELNLDDTKKLFQCGLDELNHILRVKVGDKTMMDSLIPAVEAILKEEESVFNALERGAKAAQNGADSTINLVAKYGRTKNLREKSLGYKDPGAVSIALFFEGLVIGLS
ncbi:dihydroxyacetone kinase subunit L [Anaeromicrobium sediminis]|uniref:phosphoenolpyruvate--glycerone phosphotransferase n=1 Tax=Anaeromicrobium sediminis TaxID=1478221 RepID=A0A267MK70_9FIRM|nr:dihydroxyacetone kinase subunit L [Anaeromicrobium sediminis]PAB59812.1 hypothetical protein CCE28_07600 [Anaeromicrobium sediminis]